MSAKFVVATKVPKQKLIDFLDRFNIELIKMGDNTVVKMDGQYKHNIPDELLDFVESELSLHNHYIVDRETKSFVVIDSINEKFQDLMDSMLNFHKQKKGE